MMLQAPFPWFGGKSRVAGAVWERFGDVPNYVEPFFGSGAVLLGRPHTPRRETVNDKDGYIANFWRAVKRDPEEVSHWCDSPVNENDLHARHASLVRLRTDLVAQLEGDPEYSDARIAGWWVWGISAWIGGGWCSGNGPWVSIDGHLTRRPDEPGVRRQVPEFKEKGVIRSRPDFYFDRGVQRKRPNVYNERGVQRRRPHMRGQGVHQHHQDGLIAWFLDLADRLRYVRVACGDWTRVLGRTPTVLQGQTAVFLDPPYALDVRDKDLYAEDTAGISDAVRSWAIEHGDDPEMRIALCGYDGEHEMPENWAQVAWTASGGYANMRGRSPKRGSENRTRERIWFSPHCLRPARATEQLDFWTNEGGHPA